ncbi:MAG: restriction endonuclease [Bacteroidales bacterium]|nr:restriction endonuclease [Bacteroidales bacterium]
MKILLKGKDFEKEIANILKLMGYDICQNKIIAGNKIDIYGEIKQGFSKSRIIVECKNQKSNKNVEISQLNKFAGIFINLRNKNIIDHAYFISKNNITPEAFTNAKSSGINALSYNELLAKILDCDYYIERVIYDYEHYEEYDPILKNPRKPIIEIMERSNLYKYYVPLKREITKDCQDSRDLFNYVTNWINKEDKNHLSILGDYGTGKSSFALNLTYELSKKFRENPIGNRIPIFISLKDYQKGIYVETLITNLLINDYNVSLKNFTLFQKMNELGKLIIILDGFDEMASTSDENIIEKNFKELVKLIRSNSKIILTCRTHFFKGINEAKKLFQPVFSPLLKRIKNSPKFEILEISKFDNDQIKLFLGKYLEGDRKNVETFYQRIKRTYHLEDLIKRPILLDMIIKTLPELIKTGKDINSSRLYEVYTQYWIEWDDGKTKMTKVGKANFMESLAWEMFLKGDFTINFRELSAPLKEHFKENIQTHEDLDCFDYDIRTCSFLNSDSIGNYRFIHKSFMEFFVAKRAANFLSKSKIDPNFGKKYFSQEVYNFTAQLISEDPTVLENLCRYAFDEIDIISWNAISILPYLKSYRPESLVDHLLKFCEQKQLKAGITWIFGELGVNNQPVLNLLKSALNKPECRSPWWEAAFALKKLNKNIDPINELINTLPLEWTYKKAITHIRKWIDIETNTDHEVDQRAVIAIIKKHRENDNLINKIEENIAAIFNQFDVLSDTKSRRSYYIVWLIGELHISSILSKFTKIVDHPLAAVRNMLAEALGKICKYENTNRPISSNNEVLFVLNKLLRDRYYRTRLHSAEAIGEIRAYSLLPDLKEVLEHESLGDVQNAMLKSIQLLEDSK